MNNTMDGMDISNERPYKIEEYPTQRIIIAILYGLLSLTGLLGNFLVILAVILSKKLRTITNVFVVNLSIADCLTCLMLPFNIVGLLNLNGDQDMYLLSENICKGAALILFTCAGCSVYTLAAIGINRWYLITRPVRRYRTFFAKGRITCMVFIVWFIPFLTAMLPPLLGLGELGYARKYASCTHKTSHPLSDYYSMLQSAIVYPIPLITIVSTYVLIFIHIREHAKIITEQPDVSTTSYVSNANAVSMDTNADLRKRLSRRQLEITRNLFYVVCAFFICITPYCIVLFIPPSDPLVPWTAAIFLVNSCVNPFIYATKHPHFKVIFKLILTCKCSQIPEKSRIMRTIRSMRSIRSMKGRRQRRDVEKRNGKIKAQIAGLSSRDSFATQ